MIRIEDVVLRRNGVGILNGASWSAGAGEDWAVIGLNGSGKTSMLRCATGDFWPTSGKVFLFGGELGKVDLPALKKKIGWVGGAIDKWLPPSETALRLVVTGLHHTYELYRVPTAEELDKGLAVLDSLGCSHIAQRPFVKLSQGEKQKVRIARSLVSEPQLLILDEVCAGLDIKSREHLLHSLSDLQGPSFMFVTHHIEELLPRVNKVLVMKDGQVMAAGDKADVLTSERMSQAFDLPIAVECDEAGRYWMRVC